MANSKPAVISSDDVSSLSYWISKIPEFTFSPKRPYGLATYGMFISYLNYKGQRVRVQVGEDPNPLPDENGNVDVDPKKLVKTHFGISLYQGTKDDDDNLSSTMAPGVPSNNQYTQPSFPQPGQQQQQQSSNASENNNRRTLDIQVHPDNELFFEFCRLLDERVKYELESRCKEFFDRPSISAEMLDDKYKGVLSESKNGNFRYLNGKVDTNRCDIRKALLKRKVRKATHDEVEKYSYITPCIEFTGICFKIKSKSVLSVTPIINIPSLLTYESPTQESFTVQLPAGYSMENSSDDEDEKDSKSRKRKQPDNSGDSEDNNQMVHKKSKTDNNSDSDDDENVKLPGDAASLIASQKHHGFPQQ